MFDASLGLGIILTHSFQNENQNVDHVCLDCWQNIKTFDEFCLRVQAAQMSLFRSTINTGIAEDVKPTMDEIRKYMATQCEANSVQNVEKVEIAVDMDYMIDAHGDADDSDHFDVPEPKYNQGFVDRPMTFEPKTKINPTMNSSQKTE